MAYTPRKDWVDDVTPILADDLDAIEAGLVAASAVADAAAAALLNKASTTALTAESTARAEGDSTLDGRLDTVETVLPAKADSTALAAEQSARAAADTVLSGRVGTVETGLLSKADLIDGKVPSGQLPPAATSGAAVLLDGVPLTESDPLDIDTTPVVAADIPFTPTGSTGAMTVQDALVEVAADAAAATAALQVQVTSVLAQLNAAKDRITLLEGGAVISALLTESGNVLTTEAGDVLVLA